MKNIETFISEDGTIGLYNKELDEIYHSKFGAKTEAIDKFVNPAKIVDDHPLDILDICYGIGYNTKCAIENYTNISSIDCVETDKELMEKSYEFEFNPKINKIIEDNLKKQDFICFFAIDARDYVKTCIKKYDIIFHDGFAPYKQSVLWSEDFISKLSNLLKPNGIYCTYNHSKPVLKALCNAGLTIGKTNANSIVASFCPNLIKNPLNKFEIGELNTKSAITYKDKNLDLTHEEIIQQRLKEISSSNLQTLSRYKKSHKT